MRTADDNVVNDVHSRLNCARVRAVHCPRDLDDLRRILRRADRANQPVSLCGLRHAMGGQQFAQESTLIDMSEMNRAIGFDPKRGLIQIEAGADWPTVIRATHEAQPGSIHWAIRQKQTGADRLTLGGALAANVHGRGLLMRPIVDDVESFQLLTVDGENLLCSRELNRELFSLAIGGYGLFGIITSVTLRLAPRRKLRRLVDVLDIDDAIVAVHRRVEQGCIYGDFQYAIDPADDSFLRRGVCACYQPVDDDTPISSDAADLARDDWLRLLQLAHDDKPRAFAEYSTHYLRSHGRVYWSDTMQLSTYLPAYSQLLERDGLHESLVIGEQFVPPVRLPDFLREARAILRRCEVEDIYGTIRSIRKEDETFLRWASDDFACVIFNLRTPHDEAGIARTATAFGALNEAAIKLDGSFYLTYSRSAARAQIEAAYPMFRDFLIHKREHDPDERFTSDWFRHYSALFA